MYDRFKNTRNGSVVSVKQTHCRAFVRQFSDAAASLSKSASKEVLNPNHTRGPADLATGLPKSDPEPPRITCLTIGSRGDVQPYIALCLGLIARNYKCTIATHAKFKDWIEGSKVDFREVAGDPEELIRHCTENGIKSLSFWTQGRKKFGSWFNELLQSSWDAAQGSDVLIESPSTMVGVHIAQSLNIPYIRAFTMPWTKTGAYPHAMATMGQSWAGWMNKLSYKLFDGLTWLLTRKEINLWRQKYLKLNPTTLAELKLSEFPFLYNFSPSVAPKPSDWGPSVHVTGYWFVEPKTDAHLSEDLEQAIAKAKEQRKKIVYIGFGSIIVPDPKKMTDAVIEAVNDSKVFAIISGGWTAGAKEGAEKGATEVTMKGTKGAAKQAQNDAEDTAAYMKRKIGEQSSMHYVDSVPHDLLFTKISAALHHGGAGTTAASIRAGIPTLIKPFFGDQYFWAQRVETLGVGTHVRSLDRKTISDALIKATSDPVQIKEAAVLGEKVSKENGVHNAIELIVQSMDVSRSLIKNARELNLQKKSTSLSSKLKDLRAQFTKLVDHLLFVQVWQMLRLKNKS